VSVRIADRVAAAAARTVEARTARIFSAWSVGTPVPQTGDRRCEGVADLSGRRARVSHVLFFTERLTVDLARADAILPAGVSVPAGPYRALRAMPAEVWLDADGRVRRVAVSTEPAAAPGERTWAIAELWDFGITVDIALPGPDGA
jgi:hypothetical protein